MVHPKAEPTAHRSLGVHRRSAQEGRLSITYPATAGRNFDEVLRVIDSLQLTDAAQGGHAGELESGDDVIICPRVEDEDAHGAVSRKGWNTLKPYLRHGEAGQVSAAAVIEWPPRIRGTAISLMRICVYCASSSQSHPDYRAAAHRLGEVMAEAGCSIVYGGGTAGSMGTLADGALAHGGEVIGVLPPSWPTSNGAIPA